MNSLKALAGRSLLSLHDLDRRVIEDLVAASIVEKECAKPSRRFTGKTLALLFEKPSTRTRAAFSTAFGAEDGHVSFLSAQDLHLGVKESVEDTARVLGSMYDAIAYRGFAHQNIELLAAHAKVPVINALTDRCHPTEALADMMTLLEVHDTLEEEALLYCGDAQNNVATSLLTAACTLKCHIYFFSPEQYTVDSEALKAVTASDRYVHCVQNIEEVPRSLVAVYTDVWISMGQEAQKKEREALLAPFQVDEALMERFPQAMFLHCLPAERGKEVSAAVIDGPRSRVWEQALNRKFILRILLAACLGVL